MKSEQIQKLKSLGELLANGTISTEEFNTLKAEILNLKIQIDEQPPHNPPQPEVENLKRVPEKKLNKQKIRLIGFQNTTSNKFINPPNIDELDINNINKDEEKLLKPFLRLKQIFSPANFTADEINIGNKLFTRLEIDKINSERPGLNFPWAVIISVISAGISLFLMYISPCFGFLGAGTGMVSAALMAIYVLTRVSATKMDKILSVIAILLSIGAFIAYSSHFKGNSWELKDNNETMENTTNEFKTSFESGDELFDYISFGYYGYSDLVKQWGEAQVGRPYINDRNDGFNVSVEWDNIKVNGSTPSFEFSVSESDGESPISFKGFTLNDRVFEY